MAKTLTTAAVKKFAKAKTRRIIRDAGSRSLYLVVQPSGFKSWQMRFRKPDGRAAKIVLGPVDLSGSEVTGEVQIGMPLTLAGARTVAAQVHRARSQGTDVIGEHKARRHRKMAEAASRDAGSFGVLAKKFIEEHAKKTRGWQVTAKNLGLDPNNNLEPIPNGLAARWADRDVAKIDSHDVYTIVDEALRIGIPGIKARNAGLSEARARSAHAALSATFGWLLRHRRISANPCAGVFRPPPPVSRDRVLSNAEIVKFWRAAEVVGTPFGQVLKLLLLTGARLNEIARLELAEMSEDGSQINLPGTRTKNYRAHTIPLSPLAQEIIMSLPRIDGSAFVFSTNGRTPVIIGSKVKGKLDAAMGDVPSWRVHDLRRTAVTGMAELGIRPDLIEMIVNHISGSRGGIAGVYNKSEQLAERRSALERWSNHVAGLVSGGTPGNVVSMGKRR